MAEKTIENKKVPRHEHECPKCGKSWGCIMPTVEGAICRRELDNDVMCWTCERPLIREKLNIAPR